MRHSLSTKEIFYISRESIHVLHLLSLSINSTTTKISVSTVCGSSLLNFRFKESRQVFGSSNLSKNVNFNFVSVFLSTVSVW